METEQEESPLSEEERRTIRSQCLTEEYSSCMRLVRNGRRTKAVL